MSSIQRYQKRISEPLMDRIEWTGTNVLEPISC
jgi:predicted ATPase with chaperone activity